MFGWLYFPRCLRRLISLRTFMGTPSSPSWIFTFFIATTVSVFRSRALYTVAYAPENVQFEFSKLSHNPIQKLGSSSDECKIPSHGMKE